MPQFIKTRYIAASILAGVFLFSAGVYLGFHKQVEVSRAASIESLLGQNSNVDDVDFREFWKAWEIVNQKHPDASKVSNQERVYGAISGMLESLDDPYTVFFPADDAKSFQEDISGKFIGVGMEVGKKDKVLTVIAPLKDTPAYRAGIKSGDKIIKIDETSTAGLTVEDAVKLIRGDKGTAVTLTVLRDGEKAPREIRIVRAEINMPTLEAELRSDGVFVVRLFSFSATSPGLFKNAIAQFEKSKSDKLIIDLRGNPGGYLDAAVSLASYFLESGQPVVLEDMGTNKERKVYRSKGFNSQANNKIVVLIDSGSASASEILAGALQDHKKALLVGEKSYGKGSVQEIVKMDAGTLLKITIAKWLTPNGNSISEVGLTPDYTVEITPKDVTDKKDPQMDKAVELLKNWPGIK